MPHLKPTRILALIASLLYVLVFPVVGLILSWMWLHWIIASVITFLAVLIWPLLIYDTIKRPEHEPVFTGQIDHPGGGIGVAIALTYVWHLMGAGNLLWGTIALITLLPVLGITFSLLSEASIYAVQRWLWNRRCIRLRT